MFIDVHITKVATGEIRIYADNYVYDQDGENSDSLIERMWESGNYSCDCNRYLFFERPGGGNPYFGTHLCSEELYRVKIVERGTDRVIYQEEHL